MFEPWQRERTSKLNVHLHDKLQRFTDTWTVTTVANGGVGVVNDVSGARDFITNTELVKMLDRDLIQFRDGRRIFQEKGRVE